MGSQKSWTPLSNQTAAVTTTPESQRRPGIVGNHQKLEEIREVSPLEPSKGIRPYQNLDFRLLASRTVGDYISVALSHPNCGNLLWWP